MRRRRSYDRPTDRQVTFRLVASHLSETQQPSALRGESLCGKRHGENGSQRGPPTLCAQAGRIWARRHATRQYIVACPQNSTISYAGQRRRRVALQHNEQILSSADRHPGPCAISLLIDDLAKAPDQWPPSGWSTKRVKRASATDIVRTTKALEWPKTRCRN